MQALIESDHRRKRSRQFGLVNTKATSTTSLISSLNPSSVGTSVAFTASVTGSAPTGTVAFTDGGSAISGSAWGAAEAPDGVQTAFIQSMGTISQTLSLNAGSYTLSFQAAHRSWLHLALPATDQGDLGRDPDRQSGVAVEYELQ